MALYDRRFSHSTFSTSTSFTYKEQTLSFRHLFKLLLGRKLICSLYNHYYTLLETKLCLRNLLTPNTPLYTSSYCCPSQDARNTHRRFTYFSTLKSSFSTSHPSPFKRALPSSSTSSHRDFPHPYSNLSLRISTVIYDRLTSTHLFDNNIEGMRNGMRRRRDF